MTREEGNKTPLLVEDLFIITELELTDAKLMDKESVDGVPEKAFTGITELLFNGSVLLPKILYLGLEDSS